MKLIERFTVRDYLKEDFPQVRQLWQETGLDDGIRGDNEETIDISLKMGGKFIILEENLSKTIIGTSWMTFDGRRIHLHHFGIKPGYQNKGLGRLLTAKSLEFAEQTGIQIKLEVHEENVTAIHLYRSMGFEYLGDYRVYIIRDPGNYDVRTEPSGANDS